MGPWESVPANREGRRAGGGAVSGSHPWGLHARESGGAGWVAGRFSGSHPWGYVPANPEARGGWRSGFRDGALEWLPANSEGRGGWPGGFPGGQGPGDPRQQADSGGQGRAIRVRMGVGLEKDRPGSRGLTRGSDWLAGRARAGQNRRNLSVAASCGRYPGDAAPGRVVVRNSTASQVGTKQRFLALRELVKSYGSWDRQRNVLPQSCAGRLACCPD